MTIFQTASRPEGDRLRPVTDPPIMEQLLEVGAHRPMGHPQSLGDLLIRESVRGQREDLRLARRQAAGAKIDAVASANVPVSETTQRFIPRRAEDNSARLSCAYR